MGLYPFIEPVRKSCIKIMKYVRFCKGQQGVEHPRVTRLSFQRNAVVTHSGMLSVPG